MRAVHNDFIRYTLDYGFHISFSKLDVQTGHGVVGMEGVPCIPYTISGCLLAMHSNLNVKC